MFQNSLWKNVERLTYVVVVVVVVRKTTILKVIPRELPRKIAHFKEIGRQQWGCVSGELGYRLWWTKLILLTTSIVLLLGVAPY